MRTALPLTVASIPKGEAEVRVSLDEFKGALTVDVRVFEEFSAPPAKSRFARCCRAKARTCSASWPVQRATDVSGRRSGRRWKVGHARARSSAVT